MRCVGVSEGMLNKAKYPNHVWTYDFMHDQTEDGRTLRWTNFLDPVKRRSVHVQLIHTTLLVYLKH